ncbi:MAG: FecR family protein, partial [Elainellaceae cyanobacterium]
MSRKFVFFLTSLLLGASYLALPTAALADTALTRAVIQALRNDVDLLQQGRSSRTARVSDSMNPGDALSTERQSFAELRFNDGSLARVGERVLFRFVPNTRTFRLNNGTMLLLVPPGQGRTRIQTPNATAGIRGSALFVRYNEDTNTTLVGALTDSGIEVFNNDETQQYELRPGELAVVVDGVIERVYQFDLERFYETSELVRGLNLDTDSYYANRGSYDSQPPDEAIALVRDETIDALGDYSFDEGGDVLETPSFLWMSATPDDLEDAGLTGQSTGLEPIETRPGLDNTLPDVDRVLDAAEFQDRLNPGNQPNNPG